MVELIIIPFYKFGRIFFIPFFTQPTRGPFFIAHFWVPGISGTLGQPLGVPIGEKPSQTVATSPCLSRNVDDLSTIPSCEKEVEKILSFWGMVKKSHSQPPEMYKTL